MMGSTAISGAMDAGAAAEYAWAAVSYSRVLPGGWGWLVLTGAILGGIIGRLELALGVVVATAGLAATSAFFANLETEDANIGAGVLLVLTSFLTPFAAGICAGVLLRRLASRRTANRRSA